MCSTARIGRRARSGHDTSEVTRAGVWGLVLINQRQRADQDHACHLGSHQRIGIDVLRSGLVAPDGRGNSGLYGRGDLVTIARGLRSSCERPRRACRYLDTKNLNRAFDASQYSTALTREFPHPFDPSIGIRPQVGFCTALVPFLRPYLRALSAADEGSGESGQPPPKVDGSSVLTASRGKGG